MNLKYHYRRLGVHAYQVLSPDGMDLIGGFVPFSDAVSTCRKYNQALNHKKIDYIYYEGIRYMCREIMDLQCDGQILTVADEGLGELLKNDDGTYKPLDEDIFAYASIGDLLHLNDIELFNLFA